MSALQGQRILVGVCGSIAAFKAAELVRSLRREGADVTVAMTAAAAEFIGPATFAAFTEHPVLQEQFPSNPDSGVPHVEIAERYDLVVVAPATANILGKAAHAVADELLATILNIVECPVIFVPAMNYRMWRNEATRQAVERLRSMGREVLDPDTGELATGAVGEGRFPSTDAILAAIGMALRRSSRLEGQRVLVTAGPTREPIDPVRYISNRSSGKMGYALAAAARDMGADVTLISGPTALLPPHDCRLVAVETAQDMLAAVETEVSGQDYLVMAAAVADFQVAAPQAEKISRSAGLESIALQPAPDILKRVRGKFSGTVVAFSLQAGADLETAKIKLEEKGADFIVANDFTEAGAGFETETNHVWVVPAAGEPAEIQLASKAEVARSIWEIITQAADTD